MSAVNTVTHIDVLERQLKNSISSESKTHLKRDRNISSKDSVSRRRKNETKQKKQNQQQQQQ